MLFQTKNMTVYAVIRASLDFVVWRADQRKSLPAACMTSVAVPLVLHRRSGTTYYSDQHRKHRGGRVVCGQHSGPESCGHGDSPPWWQVSTVSPSARGTMPFQSSVHAEGAWKGPKRFAVGRCNGCIIETSTTIDRSRAACCCRLLLQVIDRCHMCSPAVIWLLISQRLTCRPIRRKNIIIYTFRLAMSSSCIASNRDVDVSTWPTMSKRDGNARIAVYACWRPDMLGASCPESALRPHLAPTYSRGTGFNGNSAIRWLLLPLMNRRRIGRKCTVSLPSLITICEKYLLIRGRL